MIYIDGIIYSLQKHGGISVYCSELCDYFYRSRVEFSLSIDAGTRPMAGSNRSIRFKRNRMLERYRRCVVPDRYKLFHSSYYRLPNRLMPTVTTVHDFTYEKYLNGAKKELHRLQKNRAIRISDKIICISQSTKRDLLEFLPDVSEDKIEVVYNGVSPQYRPMAFQRDTCVSDRKFVLFVGARGGYKNFDILIRCLVDLPEYRLVCVGGGPFSAKEFKILERSIPGRFSHKGFLSNQSLNDLYNHAHCLVYPSAYEGFGIPPLEALSAGCPVVVANTSSLPEVVGNAAIYLESINHEELRSAILSLEDSSLRSSLITAGLLQSSKFSWEKCAFNTLKVYSELADIQKRNI